MVIFLATGVGWDGVVLSRSLALVSVVSLSIISYRVQRHSCVYFYTVDVLGNGVGSAVPVPPVCDQQRCPRCHQLHCLSWTSHFLLVGRESWASSGLSADFARSLEGLFLMQCFSGWAGYTLALCIVANRGRVSWRLWRQQMYLVPLYFSFLLLYSTLIIFLTRPKADHNRHDIPMMGNICVSKFSLMPAQQTFTRFN